MTTVSNAWRVPNFRWVWGAGAFSNLGAEIGELALPVLALITLDASPAELSWVRAALLVPYLLLTLWLGVIVDRHRRKPLMVGADIGRGVLLLAVGGLALTGWLSIPMLIAAAGLLGALTVLYSLADFSFVPLVVDERQVIDANARITATQSAIGVAGSGAGGVLVQALTAPIAILLNAIGYLASAVMLGRVRITERTPGRSQTSAFVEAKAGLRVLLKHRILRPLVSEATIWNLGNEIFMLALAVLVLLSYGWGPLILGVILMAGGVGAFVGSSMSARLTARFGYGRSLIGALLLGNTAPLAGILIVGNTSSFMVAALAGAFLLSGVGIGVANSQSTSIRQLAIEPQLRGRVNGGYRLISWGALALGALGGGILVTVVGPWTAALLGTVGMAVATLPVVLSPVRRLDSIDDVKQTPPSESAIVG